MPPWLVPGASYVLGPSREGRTVAYIILFYGDIDMIGEVTSVASQSRTIEVAQSPIED